MIVRRWWTWLLFVMCFVPLLLWGFDQFATIHWVGSTDLTIEIVAVDADTNTPIPGFRVEVRSAGGFHEEEQKQEFVLTADASGVARKDCRNSMCFGTRSGLGFTDSYAVHLPPWRFRVTAASCEPGEWIDLNVHEYERQVKRDGPRRAKLTVSVSLRKSRAEQAAEASPARKAGRAS